MQNITQGEALNPYPGYRIMRKEHPVYFNPELQFWQVFCYDDVQRVLSDHATFSSNFGGDPDRDPLSALGPTLFSTDPPLHTQLRTLVAQAFTPHSVAHLSDRITSIVNRLLDQGAARGRMDIIGDLAYPLPVTVIAEMLGVPEQDQTRFKMWSDAVVGASNSAGGNPQAEMGAYFLNMISQRNQEPKDDLISALLDAQIGGQHLTQQELLGFCIVLLVAGNETTTNLIGNALLCFDEHPEVMELLRSEPALIPEAVEEVLRYRSPVQYMYRLVTTDVTIRDQEIRTGQMVHAWIGSANRDEAQFLDPDNFDIRRTPNQHIAFGHGIHFCLGAPLARLETRIALTLLLERFDDIQRVRDVPLEGIGSDLMLGVKNLPVTFRAATK